MVMLLRVSMMLIWIVTVTNIMLVVEGAVLTARTIRPDQTVRSVSHFTSVRLGKACMQQMCAHHVGVSLMASMALTWIVRRYASFTYHGNT